MITLLRPREECHNKGSAKKSRNFLWLLPLRGVLSAIRFFFKREMCKKHLESLPDFQNGGSIQILWSSEKGSKISDSLHSPLSKFSSYLWSLEDERFRCDKTKWRKSKQMWPVCFFITWHFDETFDNAFDRNIEQMWSMRKNLLWFKGFEIAFENEPRKETAQMLSLWICLSPCREFEDSFKIAHRGKAANVWPMWLFVLA